MEPDDTERALHDSLSQWLADRIDPALQARADLPPVPPPWRELATDLGLLAAGLPERVGGVGGGLRAQRVVQQALGGALAAAAYSAGVLGGAALQAAGTAEADAVLARLIGGAVRVAWAPRCAGARATDTTPRCTLRREGAHWRLDGRKSGVEGALWATHLLVAVTDADGPAVAWVDAGSAGLTRRDLRQLDGGSASELAFDGVHLPPTARLGGADLLERLHDLHTLMGCTEALALQRRLLADTTEHLRTRRQFGQALAAFQVLQHRLADLHIAHVQAEALTESVAAAFDEAPAGRRSAAVSSAALAVERACRLAAETAVQLHGAMGVTEELAAGRVARRLLMIALDAAHRERHLQRLDTRMHEAAA